MPLALLLMIAVARARLSARAWAAIVVCFTLIALQTVYLYPVARRIPTFELSLFVWRLAFPTAFLAFGALLAGWREVGSPPRRAVVAIATLSTIGMMLVLTGIAPLRLADASKGMSDHRALVDYDRGNGIWGVREFFPNYGGLPRACDSVGDAAKATLRRSARRPEGGASFPGGTPCTNRSGRLSRQWRHARARRL